MDVFFMDIGWHGISKCPDMWHACGITKMDFLSCGIHLTGHVVLMRLLSWRWHG
jgi:hypothetical protein